MKIQTSTAMDRVLVDRKMYTNTVIKMTGNDGDDFGYIMITPVDLESVSITEYSTNGERIEQPHYFVKAGEGWESSTASIDSVERDAFIVSSEGYI